MKAVRAEQADENGGYGSKSKAGVAESVRHRQDTGAQTPLQQVDQGLPISRTWKRTPNQHREECRISH